MLPEEEPVPIDDEKKDHRAHTQKGREERLPQRNPGKEKI